MNSHVVLTDEDIVSIETWHIIIHESKPILFNKKFEYLKSLKTWHNKILVGYFKEIANQLTIKEKVYKNQHNFQKVNKMSSWAHKHGFSHNHIGETCSRTKRCIICLNAKLSTKKFS